MWGFHYGGVTKSFDKIRIDHTDTCWTVHNVLCIFRIFIKTILVWGPSLFTIPFSSSFLRHRSPWQYMKNRPIVILLILSNVKIIVQKTPRNTKSAGRANNGRNVSLKRSFTQLVKNKSCSYRLSPLSLSGVYRVREGYWCN